MAPKALPSLCGRGGLVKPAAGSPAARHRLRNLVTLSPEPSGRDGAEPGGHGSVQRGRSRALRIPREMPARSGPLQHLSQTTRAHPFSDTPNSPAMPPFPPRYLNSFTQSSIRSARGTPEGVAAMNGHLRPPELLNPELSFCLN